MRYLVFLLLIGVGWGATTPMSKIAIVGGYRDFGAIFWQSVIMILALGSVALLRRQALPMGGRQVLVYAMIAVIGTVLPNGASYTAYIRMDAGIMAILIATVPLFAFPIALLFGLERLKLLRLVGLIMGMAGVLLLIVPDMGGVGALPLLYLSLGLLASLSYALEGNLVAKFGTAGLGPLQVLLGASFISLIVSFPLSLATGSWVVPQAPFGAPDYALVVSSLIHAVVYAGYVWLISAAGSVFAVQVGYVVTISGVFWARALLGESYSPWVWAAMLVVLAGVFLVQPKPELRLAPAGAGGQNRRD